jgi:hypothetical protein
MKRLLETILLALISIPAFSQSWAIHLNGNETYIIGNELKGQHPILWYSKAQDKIVFGGFGIGVSNTLPWRQRYALKFQANAQRSRFYDIPAILRDENGIPIGGVIGINTNYNLALLSTAMLPLDEKRKYEVGAGLGIRATFFAHTNYEVLKDFFGDDTEKKRLRNKSLTPVTLLLPLEAKFNFDKFSAGGRAEFSVTGINRLPQWKHERSMVLFLELGYRIGTTEGE